jgi:hypothetical protein
MEPDGYVVLLELEHLSQLLLIPRGSPLGLPNSLTRSPLRRLAPFVWLARYARSRA